MSGGGAVPGVVGLLLHALLLAEADRMAPIKSFKARMTFCINPTDRVVPDTVF